MHQYRVVKYSAAERDGSTPSWTSFSDIGETFDGQTLTESEYVETENKYLSAIRDFMSLGEISSLQVDGLEIYEESSWWGEIQEGEILPAEKVIALSKSILRQDFVWARLIRRDDFFIHFGYDYYMYVGVANPADRAIERSRRAGLYVDEFESPYAD
ncbi:hypothetical protein [Kitasatospora sp. NPDC056731]|uniref:hypothetical protein n=1 Tax=Kitasatospora sp. NPDC056731 TaxID=3155422 RepID=UPI00341FE15F